MVYFYDEALLQKLKSWTEKTNIYIVGPNDTARTFQMLADQSGDKSVKLPLVCLSRVGGYTLENTNKTVLSNEGLILKGDANNIVTLPAIPIKIEYQLDIYCKYLKEADMYAREFIFNIINAPTGTVVIPYNGVDYEHYYNIRIAENVEDNSDIPERFFAGEFSRMSLHIDIDDAYLWDVKIRDHYQLVSEGLTIHSSESDEITEEIK